MKYPLINEDEKEIPESIEREWLKKGKIRWKGQHNFDEIENGHACDVLGSFCTHLKWVPHSIPVIVFIFYFIYFFEQSHCLSKFYVPFAWTDRDSPPIHPSYSLSFFLLSRKKKIPIPIPFSVHDFRPSPSLCRAPLIHCTLGIRNSLTSSKFYSFLLWFRVRSAVCSRYMYCAISV